MSLVLPKEFVVATKLASTPPSCTNSIEMINSPIWKYTSANFKITAVILFFFDAILIGVCKLNLAIVRRQWSTDSIIIISGNKKKKSVICTYE